MFGNALRMGIGIGLATLLSAASSHAQLSRTTTTSRTAPVIAPIAPTSPAPAPAPPPLPAALIGSDNLAVSIFQGPHLTAYGKRAVFYWHGGSDLVLSVAFGRTTSLGSQVVEGTRLDFTDPLRGGTPTLVLHKVNLDGLDLNTAYFYRGTLTRNGVVVADTGTLPFQTPLAFARVRPVEIQMHKDGDHDIEIAGIYDNDNEGEVYLEWSAKLRRAPGDFAWTPKEKGCFPGGFSVPTSFPEDQPDVGTPYEEEEQDGSDLEYPESGSGPSIDPPDGWQSVGGCRAYSYSDPVDVDSAKVGSGDTVELDRDDYPALEWDLGADLPITDDSGLIGVANALPIDADGDGEPDWGPNGSPDGGTTEEEPPEEPCANAPTGTQGLVRLATRGQEFDTASGIGTSLSTLTNLTRIINHDVSDAELLCLDLRDEEKSYLVGVRAGSGSFEFTTWFEVTLDYRLPGEPPPADEELEALATPIVISP